MTRSTPSRTLTISLSLALAGLLAACGSGTPSATAPATSLSPTVSPSAATTLAATPAKQETDHAEPRLVVTTAEAAIVLDASTLSPLGEFSTDGTANRVTVGSDDRMVYLTSTETGVTRILDAGSWASGHGDHYHFYVGDPALLDQRLEGDEPIHQVSNAGRTAIFSDATGTAQVVADVALLPGPAEVTTVTTGGPQHGVVIPVRDGSLASIAPAPGGDPLPIGVARLDATGQELASYPDCPKLHGEAVAGDAAVFGCETSVLVVDADGARTLPLPAGSTERVGQLHAAPGSHIVVGDLAADSLALIDLEAGTVTEVAVGAPVAAIARDGAGGAVVLTTAGELMGYDTATGAETVRVAAIGAFELPQGHDVVGPQLALVGQRAHVTDPTGSALVSVDLTAGATPVVTPLPGTPLRVVATNTMTLATPDHHDH